jgi:hypothetical protein
MRHGSTGELLRAGETTLPNFLPWIEIAGRPLSIPATSARQREGLFNRS